jgi:hypothetical protein
MRERMSLHLPVRVQGRDSIDHEWTEMSRLVDVTPFGARLRLKRPTEIGRLMLLVLAMPRQLRCFDHVEDQYRVWSLVRNVKLLDPKSASGALVEIGVAFVGKRPPQSYAADPSRRYQIAKAVTDANLWSVTEDSGAQLSEFTADKRRETRHSIPIEVMIEVFDQKGELSIREKSVTENINQYGAALFTSLDISPGRFVKMSSEHRNISVLAVVRAHRTAADGIPRLHLEFIGSQWPL